MTANSTSSGPLIALDCRQMVTGVSGDRTYLAGLLAHYNRLEPQWRFLLCTQNGGAIFPDEPPPDAYRERSFAVRPGWLWTPWAWPRVLKSTRAQVAHAQYLVPPIAPCPTVVTIHDVSFLAHPEWFPARQLRVMKRLIPLSARRSTCIVTASHHAAGEIVRFCGVAPEKIRVIPHGCDSRFRPLDKDLYRERAARYGLPERYILAVGLIQPRKNLPTLLEAFAQLTGDDADLALAIVGREGWALEQVKAQVGALHLQDRTVFTGAVPDEDLPAIYNAALLLAYPSFYEGFGLPPLEAMACGTPVVAANTTSLPEVVGEAGILVPPHDANALAEAMGHIAGSVELAQRLSQAGLEQAARFSWEASARAHLDVYRELM